MSADTIFALSSGRPPAAVAVIRSSGPHAFAAIHEQLNTLYRALASRELAAGSVAARRLFS